MSANYIPDSIINTYLRAIAAVGLYLNTMLNKLLYGTKRNWCQLTSWHSILCGARKQLPQVVRTEQHCSIQLSETGVKVTRWLVSGFVYNEMVRTDKKYAKNGLNFYHNCINKSANLHCAFHVFQFKHNLIILLILASMHHHSHLTPCLFTCSRCQIWPSVDRLQKHVPSTDTSL